MEENEQHSGVSAGNEVEELLRKERDTAQRYLDVAGVILIALDTDERITLINRKGCEILGCSDQELLGQNWFDRCVPAAERETVRRTFRLLVAGDVEPVEYFENRVTASNGQERLIAWYNTIVRDDDGRITGTLSSGNDITERKAADLRLSLLSSVVEQSSEGMAVVDLDGRITYINNAFAAMHGYQPDELIGKNLEIFHGPDQLPAVTAANQKLRETGEFVGEIWHMRRDGSSFPTLMHNTLLRDSRGTPVGMVGTLQDITERVETRSALERSRSALARAQRIAHVGSWEWNMRPQEASWSDEMYNIFGLDRSTYPAFKTVRSMTHPDDLAKLDRVMEKALGDGKSFQLEFRIIRTDGSVRWLHSEVEMVVDAQGRPIQMFGTAQDITERKHAEQALRESEATYHDLVETSANIVYRVDTEGRFLFVNKTCKEVTGYEPEDLIGRRFTEFQTPEDAARLLKIHGEHMTGAPINGVDTVFISKSGQPVQLIINARVFRDADGTIMGGQGTALDITERNRAVRALQESEEKYRSLYSSMNEGVALHEIVYNRSGRPVDYRLLDLNPAYTRITGFDHNHALGQLATQLYAVKEPPLLQTFAAVAASGKPTSIEGFFEPLLKHLRISVFSPELGRFAVVCEDITEQEQAREELKRTHEQLQATLDALPDLLFEMNLEGRIIDFRAPEPSKLYAEPSAFLGRLVTDVIPAPASNTVMTALKEAAKSGRSSGYSYLLEKDGQGGWFELSVAAKGDATGPDPRFIALVRDITTRKRAEDSLRDATAQLRREREALAEKNIALKQVLDHIERERQDYKQRICQDIEQVLAPVLKHFKEKVAPDKTADIESLHENLRVMLSRDVDVMQSRFGRLTPREQEICDLIRQGLSSKEISESLNLSILTVHKHREQIREKLGLTNQSINLSTFLRSH